VHPFRLADVGEQDLLVPVRLHAMTPLDKWVNGANITRLTGQLHDPALKDRTTLLTRRLAEEEHDWAARRDRQRIAMAAPKPR
jgi:hypothetical protein